MRISSKQIVKYLLYLKAVIWGALALFYYGQQVSPNPNITFQIVALLLIVNAIIFFVLGYLWGKSKKTILLWTTIIFILANIILTITDNVGTIDIISLVTDCFVLVFVYLSKNQFSKTTSRA